MNAPSDIFLKTRYKRLWITSVLITSTVSITPLVVLTIVNYVQYQKAFQEQIRQPIYRLTSLSKRTLEYSLSERRYALNYIIGDKSMDELRDERILSKILVNLKSAFGGFIDLGLIDENGIQVSYVGPYALKGEEYDQEEWYHEVQIRGGHISDVYLGHRRFPHFAIAVKHDTEEGGSYILRATIDTNILNRQVLPLDEEEKSSAFIINRDGVLQTHSGSGESLLEKCRFQVPPFSSNTEVYETQDLEGDPYLVSYAYIENSPFIFMKVETMPDLMRNWFALRSWIVGFFLGSIILIILLVMAIASILVSRIRDADRRHEKAIHKVEYAAKMASIGRLAAGVAHEINNPLAIINEKAGLLHDYMTRNPEFPNREKSQKLVESIIGSVERGSTITHRLLGFARHIDVKVDQIDLPALIMEVLGFLEKEASYRNIKITTKITNDLPTIWSDRGQLQQVFLNIINNAFEAVDRDGNVAISIVRSDNGQVAATVSDDGPGISKEDLRHIFEPFYTTKRHGTGLGLSITYGIVKKLRGEIKVESQEEIGTRFTVTLPTAKPQ
ncbi:ATP-binding protein [Acidobacteriota bacterium]